MMVIKEKLIGLTGSISGGASILGSWQLCHNICLGFISLLSIIGITVVGMPLAFFQKIAIPLWSVAAVLWVLTYYMYYSRKCISKNLLIINAGLIIAGIPFSFVQEFQQALWLIGGIIALTGIVLWFKDRKSPKRCHVEKK